MPCLFGRRCLLASAILVALLPSPATAQVNPGLPLLREQERETRELKREQQLRRLNSPAISTQDETNPTISGNAHCWPIRTVNLVGSTLLSSRTLRARLDTLLHRCMTEAQINELLKGITLLYLEQGYLASRPYLASPLQDGRLEILVAEGFVESVELDDPDLPLSLSRAFPDLLGKPLKLGDLEQGLWQMNRLQSVDLQADLEPGTMPGGTRVVIRSQRPRTSRLRLLGSLDNNGNALVGRGQHGLQLGIDSPLEQNDFFALYSTSSLPGSPGNSHRLGLSYSIPQGPWTFSLNAARLHYRAPLPASHRVTEGRIDLYSVKLENTFRYLNALQFDYSLQLGQKRSDTRLSHSRIKFQSPTVTTLDADINLSWRDDAVWSIGLGYSQGLTWFGADTHRFNPRAPEPQFRKYRASLWQRRESTNPRLRWRWDSELALQFSPDPLTALEHIAIGDASAVRGFRDSGVSDSSGAVWRNTFSLPLNTSLPLEIRPSLGLDAGWSRFDHGAPSQRLLGLSAGLEFSRPDARLKLDYQRPLHNDSTPRHALEPGHWRAQLTLVF
ncbi:Hemolysin transporter protein ShlB precursor [Pseudomonas putida]|uniref:Hemolysin transporter protein ShlB n=1 Tax=Pseudomonas putida TaxID=303 RepID=A0A1Q9QVM1_PSEPU|nr:Hemolysin transporter protein ShlB precursor [Pseudomonas putida]